MQIWAKHKIYLDKICELSDTEGKLVSLLCATYPIDLVENGNVHDSRSSSGKDDNALTCEKISRRYPEILITVRDLNELCSTVLVHSHLSPYQVALWVIEQIDPSDHRRRRCQRSCQKKNEARIGSTQTNVEQRKSDCNEAVDGRCEDNGSGAGHC